MGIQGNSADVKGSHPAKDSVANLRAEANRTVMNKDFEPEAQAPTGVDARKGIALQVSHRDQREHGVLTRVAFDVDGQLYIQDTVMESNGDMKELWKRGKRRLHS